MMIPGRALHRLANTMCSAKAVERVVEPAIADLQRECAAASTARGRVWALLRGYCVILKVLAICTLGAIPESPDDQRALIRTISWSLGIIVAVTALLMLPPLSFVERRLLTSIFVSAVIPQALPLAIPVGFSFGIALGLTGVISRGLKRKILLVAIALSIASFVTLAWVMPAANMSFRSSWANAARVRGPLLKGPAEMTLSELRREASTATTGGDRIAAARYDWSYHLRFALALAAVALAMFLLTTGGVTASSRGLLALSACCAYWALIFIGEALSVDRSVIPTFAGAWLPNLAFVMTAIVVVSSRSVIKPSD